MPVAYLGLTVSHVPSSTSFYLNVLQPLGYRYIGQRGNSVGLGIDDADFFLSESSDRSKISPTHVAFTADSSATVRECYAAALNAQAQPSGAPGYRSGDCDCFNAAILDPDGNTIEFIYRQSQDGQDTHCAPSVVSRSNRPRSYEDDRSVATGTSRMTSRTKTAMDIASQVSKSTKQSSRTAPSPGISRSRTEPVTSEGNNKAIFGTVLGAAAGAFVAYAMAQSERESTQDELEYHRSHPPSSRGQRNRSDYAKSSTTGPPPRRSDSSRRSRLAIEPPSYIDEYDDMLSRHTSRRPPAPQRSRTYDAIEYPPRSMANSRGSDRYSMKRSSTLPADGPEYIPAGAWTAPTSRRTSRRGSLDDSSLTRHDSARSVPSHRSSSQRPSEAASRRSSTSKVSTVKPYRRNSVYESAAGLPLPPSQSQSYVTSASQKPLPSSRATSYVSAATQQRSRSRADSGYVDAAYESDGLGDTKTVVPEDSISCVDFSAPKSRSRGGSDRKKSSRGEGGGKRSEAGSQSTVRRVVGERRGSRYSAQTVPAPAREGGRRRGAEGGRSAYSYA